MTYYCACDGETYDPYIETRPTARKAHKCYECGGPIVPGDVYHQAKGFYEREWHTHRTCPRCTALLDFVRAHVPCFCFPHGSLIEEAVECAQAAAEAEQVPGLLFGARRRQALIYRANKRMGTNP